jgi:hypothetical protein
MENMAESHRLLRVSEADKRQKSGTLLESDISKFKAPVVSDDEIETLY